MESPTYHNLGNHSETIEIVYDPSVISYRDLLDVFWYSHSPTAMPYSYQYKSIIFYHNDEQKALAEESKNNIQAGLGRQVYTEIVPAGTFYPAEDYHQKYYLRGIPRLEAELEAKYPDITEFSLSTAVARANGYAGGFGTPEVLREELGLMGLSPEGEAIIKQLVERRGIIPACPASVTP